MRWLGFIGIALLIGVSACVPQADLCACALAPRAGESVYVTEESALIVWDAEKKTQHFVRRAAFNTKAQDFGFLVPTPTRPTLSEVEDAVFGYLVNITRPPVREAPKATPRGEQKVALAAAAPAVAVLESVTVAGLDAAVLEASDAASLNRWLRDHGYSSGPELEVWFKPYVAAKWIITAFKIAKGQSTAERAVTSAVRMSFRTDRPFFPYREPPTPGSDPRALEVYIVSSERVEGRVGTDGGWPGRALWAQPLSASNRKELLDRVKLPADAAPEGAWLMRFIDTSSPRPGTDELYFARSADQSQYLDAFGLEAELRRKEEAAARAAYSTARATALRPNQGDSTILFNQATELEKSQRYAEAIRIYRRAARAGSGEAALRLFDIFDKGRPGVSRDYPEALQWRETAKQLGAKVESRPK